MPKFTMKSKFSTKALRILDSEGRADASLLPDIDDEFLVRMLKAMIRARRVDEKRLELQRRGDIGTFAPVKGQEAAQIGAIASLKDSDWMVPAFRESAAMLWRGTPVGQLLLYDAGYNEGGAIDKDSRDLPIAIPVASQLPHAAGIAYAAKYRRDSAVVMTFFGDGATSEGDFHEALNFAALQDLPVVFVCQNNHWAISTPRRRQTRSRTLAQKALAYGMPGLIVDGNDLLAVYAAGEHAVERARQGAGPTLIECDTYRMEVHTTADDPTRYRDEEEVTAWAERDPIARVTAYARERGAIDDSAIDAFKEQVEQEIHSAWEETSQYMAQLNKRPLAMFEHLYGAPGGALQAQRDWLERYLEGDGE
ncbi:MAG: pyruvate dehydrogenase (acetyl-transferring) E1 component subunit alpha [Halioglobus sp.]|nr:pyruvate dehydrogenase (acetyl-transferring) E1 component subunit alpha [Halioglobus sp.]